MTVAHSVGDVLDNHVTLEVEFIDRMYLNLYVPKLMYPAGVVGFFRGHRGMSFASGALMDPISKRSKIVGVPVEARHDIIETSGRPFSAIPVSIPWSRTAARSTAARSAARSRAAARSGPSWPSCAQCRWITARREVAASDIWGSTGRWPSGRSVRR